MRLILTILILIVLLSCNQSKVAEKPETNDTTEVLRLLLDSALNKKKIVDYKYLLQDNPFHDSIVLLQDSVYTQLLPEITGIKLKVMAEDEICTYATTYEADLKKSFPMVLQLRHFAKTDSGYIADLNNIGVLPVVDGNGKPYFNPDIGKPYKGDESCLTQAMTGGSYTIGVIKTKDSLYVKWESGSIR